MRGKKYLKVTGFLTFLIGLAGIVIYGIFDLILGMAVAFDRSGGGVAVFLIALFYLVWSVLSCYFGFSAVKNCDNAQKADTLHTYGLILIIASVLSFSVQHIGQPSTDTASCISDAISLCAGIVIPALYTYGAKLNLVSVPNK